MAFLEVLTRVYKRPRMLAVNQASLQAQTDSDWVQSLLVDEVGEGVGRAQERLAEFAEQLTGDYVWILDDDDMCIRETLVAELKHIAAMYAPDVIMLRMDHGIRGILPDGVYWEAAPACAHIGCSAYVVRREVWLEHSGAFFPGEYASDFKFISEIFTRGPMVYWHDVIASQVQRISLGYPE